MLRRFFGGAKEPPPPSDDPDGVVAEDDASDETPEDGSVPEAAADTATVEAFWRQRAADVIPGGASTGSKRPAALYGDENTTGPTHFVRASGCHVVTVAEETLIDCTSALGAVSIGYADETVTRAALAALASGHVAGLSHHLEVEIAERLCDVIPCAEQVRFLKSGAEGVSAAVRIARAATGRNGIVASGYFGWHDWASDALGIPSGARADIRRVPFDDIAALEAACRATGDDLAAVLLEPVVERLPSAEWIAMARRITHERGAVLIFDEMKTGFRLRPGGYQEHAGVEPDLAVFGKAMANGFPIAAVVGRSAVMQAASNTWISSTLAGEALSLAAVGAVLDRYEADDVCETLGTIGASMRDSVVQAIAASGISGVTVEGLDQMWFMRFADPVIEQRFLEQALARGVLFKRGPYNYPSLAHGEDDLLIEIEHAVSSAFVDVIEEHSA